MRTIVKTDDYVAIEFLNSEIVNAMRHANLIPEGFEPRQWNVGTGHITVEFERSTVETNDE